MPIYQLIINFRNFLTISWTSIIKIMEYLDWDDSPYFIDDWIQANWELLVEKQTLEAGQLLVPYGYNSSPECRYTHTGNTVTHRVVCKKKNDPEYRYIFLCFKSKVDETFKIEPPFNCVGVEDVDTGDRLSVAFEDLEFSIEPIGHRMR